LKHLDAQKIFDVHSKGESADQESETEDSKSYRMQPSLQKPISNHVPGNLR
jgi:hypothetical protein